MKFGLITYYLRLNDYPTKYSLAGLRLGEYLNSVGIDVELLTVSLINLEYEKFVKENILNKYEIVGISNYVWSKDVTVELAKAIRKYAPKVEIIIGGPEVKYINLNEYDNEIFILGEGETSLEKTIRYIEQGKKDKNFFKNNVNIFDKKNPDRMFKKENLEYKNSLFTKFKNVDRDYLYYETSRGCAYNCGYCGFKNRNNVELFDLEFIEEEIKKIGEMGFKEVFIVDANLGGTPIRAKKILALFNKYASNSLLTIYLRPEFIDDEMIKLLSDANLREVRIGIQTTNKNIPDWIRSNCIESINKQLPKLTKHNIYWKAEFIIGLPGDNIEGLKNSILFAKKVLKPSEICCYPLTLIRGTPLFELVNSKSDKWIKMDNKFRAYESYSYTNEEFLQMLEYAKFEMNEYLKNQSNIDKKLKEKKIKVNKKIYKDLR